MELSVIIVNYNVRYFLDNCLRSALAALQHVDGEIIVVDNNSQDDSPEMVRSKYPTVQYHYLNENLGFSKGNNYGIERAKSKYVLLLNPDTLVAEDTFRKCVDHLKTHPNAAGLGVHMIEGHGQFLPESKRGIPTPLAAFYKISGLSSLFPKSKTFSKYHVAYLDKDHNHEVEILSGAFMMMERQSLLSVGALDEEYFMYGEDIDLSYKLLKSGNQNLYFAGTHILHYKGESTKKDSINYVFVFYRAMAIFAKKHFDKELASVFSAFIHLAIYARAGVAVFRRIIGRHWQLIIDFATILLSFVLATRWYASISHKVFSEPFIDWLLPVYAGLLSIVLQLSGAHDQPFRAFKFFRGWTIAAVFLLAAYALFPESYRFSRAVIVIGVGGSLAVGLLWRLALMLLKPTWLPNADRLAKRRLVVGNESSLRRASQVIDNIKIHSDFLAGVSINNTTGSGFVCNIDQIEDAIREFRVQEIILDPEVVSHKSCISLIEEHGESVEFKILNETSLVGSNEVVAAHQYPEGNQLFHIDIQPVRRFKRLFDVAWAILMIVLFPIVILFVDKRWGFVKNTVNVLLGYKSWTGYDPRGSDPWLPKLKPAPIHPNLLTIWPEAGKPYAFKSNVAYLQEYNMTKDLALVIRHFHALGN